MNFESLWGRVGQKRRVFTDKFKAKVAMEAVKGIKTLPELASDYQVKGSKKIYEPFTPPKKSSAI